MHILRLSRRIADRDSLTKVRNAVAVFNREKVHFAISLGDLKDTDASLGCTKSNVVPSTDCVNRTVGFLKTIEAELAEFTGSRFHILGNHDVDIL